MNQHFVDYAALMLAGNTLVKLVENNVIPHSDALDTLEVTLRAFKNDEDLRKTDIDIHFQNLKAKLQDSCQGRKD